MWQAREVVRLLKLHPVNSALNFEIKTESALGDNVLDKPLAQLATAHPGLFTKELEVGLVSTAYDIAVHSLKDMPTTLPEGLVLAGIGRREDPRDALVVAARHRTAAADGGKPISSLADLPPGAVVGTSSLRREAIVRRDYPHLKVHTVRGNLNTRMKKLDSDPAAEQSDSNGAHGAGAGAASTPVSQPPDAPAPATSSSSSTSSEVQNISKPTPEGGPPSHYDALLLAAAGLVRMGWTNRITHRISPQDMPHGVGQGALGIECRENAAAAARLARSVSHGPSAIRCLAERSFLNALQGGCQVPIGVHSYLDRDWELAEGDSAHGHEGGAAAALPGSGSSGVTVTLSKPSASSNPLPAPAADDDGTPAAPERVRSLTIIGTVVAVDGSRCVTATVTEPVVVPDCDEAPSAASSSDVASAVTIITQFQWIRMCDDGRRIGRALADKIIKAGGADILGPIVEANRRPITYGAAEQPLDR